MSTKRNIAIAIAAALGLGLVLNSGVLAHGRGQGFGGGHMMGGPGYGQGYGGGHMMGGRGYGMHGPAASGAEFPGMGHHQGLGPVWTLDLTDAQRAEVTKVQDTLRKRHWDLQGKLEEQYSLLRDLNVAETPDKAAIDEVYDDIFKLRRQFVQATTDAKAELTKQLSAEQREAIAGWRRGGPGPCFTNAPTS